MRHTSRVIVATISLLLTLAPVHHLQAQAMPTLDEIIGRYLKTVGGMDRIQSIKSLRRVGKYSGDGGFEYILVQENKRPELVREEFTIGGMTGINGWDGRIGWKINPFEGKKDAEPLSENEMHSILLDADFDEPLVNYRAKGSKAELLGMDQVEGTDVYKIKVSLKNGDTRIYYLDTDYYVPIKIEDTEIIRGSEQEFETTLGDYKEVGGWLVPFSIEAGAKGQPKGRIVWEKIEPNVALDDSRFHKPEIK